MSALSIIDKLKDISNANLIDVLVPSIGTYIKFRQLSVKQQKDLIKTGLEGVLSGVHLDNVINSIIIENSATPHDFLVVDKLSIAVALRLASFGTKYVQNNDEAIDLAQLQGMSAIFDTEFTKEVNFNGIIKVNLAVPTLKSDTNINQQQLTELKNVKDLNIGDAVGSLYVYEIVKFVQSIEIEDDLVNFSTIPLSAMVKIVESLPATLNNEIIQYIQSFRKQEEAFLTVGDKTVVIDARFFTIE